jgi:hypothetical protein
MEDSMSRFRSFSFILFLVILVPLVSCEVGLGAAVDTEAPTVSITYPSASAVIKGTFILAGACSDDKSVSSIAVNVRNVTTGTSTAYTVTSDSITSGSSWKLSLNNYNTADSSYYNGWQFPDGKYEITAVASDAAGHTSGTTARTVEIDNTAPLFILKSPASSSISSPTAYGTIFKINGSISEDHTVSTMAVTIYDSNSNVVADTGSSPYTESNLITAGGTSVTIAQYSSSDTASALSGRYVSIYGDVSSKTTKNYTCAITLTDNAKAYTDPTESTNTTTGNTTSLFYLADDITSLTGSTGLGLTVDDIKNIYNGTLSNGNKDTVLSTLSSKYSKKAAFSLNPDASPKYKVSGYSFTGSTISNTAVAEQKITVTAAAGLNDNYICPETLKVYLYGPYSSLPGDITTLYNDPSSYTTGRTLLAENSSYSSGSVETYNYSVLLPGEIEGGKIYLVAVTGEDAAGNTLVPDSSSYFGFTGVITGNPPTVTVTSPTDLSVISNASSETYSGFTIKGTAETASSASTTIEKVTYTYTIATEDSSSVLTGSTGGTVTMNTEKAADGTFGTNSVDWSITVPTDYIGSSKGLYLYTFNITATNKSGGAYTTKTVRYHVDTRAPVVSITSVTPVITGNYIDSSSGSITFTGNVVETNLTKVLYTISEAGIALSSYTDIDLGKSYSFSIPFTLPGDLATDKAIILTVTATDDAGNTYTKTSASYYKDTTSPVLSDFTVDKSAPNADKWYGSATEIAATFTEKQTGLAAVYYWLNPGTAPTDTTLSSCISTAKTLSVSSTTGSGTVSGFITGTNTLYIAAEDKAGNYSTVTSYTIQSDTAYPVIKSTTTNTSLYTNASADLSSITGTVTDSPSGVATMTATISVGGSDTLITTSDSVYPNGKLLIATDGTWTLTLLQSYLAKIAGKTAAITVTATDKAGNGAPSVSICQVTCDTTAPVVKITAVTPTVTDSGRTCVNGTITITGTISELNLSNVTYSTISGTTAVETGKTFDEGSAIYAFSKTINTTSGYTDGADFVLSVTATDKAGNSTTYTTTDYNSAYNSKSTALLVKQSTDAPQISLSNADTAITTADEIKAAYTGGKNKTNIFGTKSNNSLLGTITDDDGIASVQIVYDTSETGTYPNTIFNNAAVGGTTSYAISGAAFSSLTEGLYYLKIIVTDTKQATSYATLTTSYFAIAVDNGGPTITASTDAATNYYFSNTMSVSGTVKDGSGTATITADYGVSGAVSAITNPSASVTNGTSWSDTVNVLNVAEGTGYTATYTATDAYGQTSSCTITYSIDRTAPVSVISSEKLLTVGGKTFETSDTAGSFFNTDSLSFKGYYKEEGSGISEIEYWLNPSTTPNATNVSTLTPSGSLSPSTTKGEACLYQATISGFTAANSGLNLVYFSAKDIAGNYSVPLSLTIYIDKGDPSAAAVTYKYDGDTSVTTLGEDAILTNAKKAITITGSASDTAASDTYGAASGIKTVTAYAGSSTYAVSPSVTTYGTISGTDSWTLTLNTTLLAKLSGLQNVYIVVTDNAGNTTTQSICSLQVDTTAPIVTFTAPAVNATVNKTITITGTASDNRKLASAVLSASTDGNTWKTIDSYNSAATINTLSIADDNTWSVNLDTTDYYASATSGTLTLKLVGTDSAGNSSSELTRAVTVDQNADRPKIKITDISGNNGILKYGTSAQINGTVTDDDSTSTTVVKALLISGSQITAAAASGSDYICTAGGTENITFSGSTSGTKTIYENTAYGTTTFTAFSGEWTYQPADTADGTKTAYFYVIDNAGGIFYTGQSTLGEPYVQFKTNTMEDNGTAVTYKSDSTAPEIASGKVNYGSAAASLTTTPVAMTTSLILGGTTNRYAQFVISASDANGIAGMELTASGASTQIQKIATAATVGDDTGLTASGSFTTTTDSTPTSWTTGTIDLSSYTTGSVSVSVKVYDQSGLYSNGTYTFILDNSGPDITVTSPSNTVEVTGSVSMSGIATDEGGSSTASIKWLIPTTAQTADTTAALAALTWKGTLASGKTAGAWEFIFNGKADGNDLLTMYDTSDYYTSYTNGIYVLPVYFMATDSLGNYTIYKYSIKHNPDADKPVTAITYPTASDYDTGKEYITLGGTIRVTGTCVIPSGTTSVSIVYIQVSDSDGSFDSDDSTKASGTYGYTVVNYSTAGISSGWTTDITTSNWWGIAATKTSSTWYINLNAAGKMNPSGSGTTNNIKIRACAVNTDGKVGAWSDVYSIHIDNTAPTATASLKQYQNCTTENPSSATITASTAYTADMYLKGNWYLVVKLADESGISSSTVTVKEGTTALSSGTGYYMSAQTFSSTEKGYYVYIPVSTTSSSITYTISATDTDNSGAHTITPSYSLNIDNTAPTVNTLKGNSSAITSSTPIEDSNYVYTLSSSVDETGSGFSRVVFYYMRTINNVLAANQGKTECVFDPMINYSSDTSAKVLLTSTTGNLTKLTVTQGSDSYYLYGKTVTGATTQSSTQQFTPGTSTDITGNKHIRVGGLIYIGGVYRTITAIDSSTGTVSFDTDASETYDSAVFPYAQVVDNTSAESISDYSSDPFSFNNSSDDGDGMPESITKAGTTWTWSGTVHSSHMPDGPVTIVCLAFDEAGNVSEKTVSTKITNNSPRLAKVNFGTDLNGDGSYSTSEFVQYDMYSKLGAVQSAVSINTADYSTTPFTVKNKLAVVPEFTGGNGTIKMVFSRGATTTTPVTGTDTALLSAAASVTTSGTATTVNTSPFSSVAVTKLSGDTLYAYSLADDALETTVSDSNDGTGKSMSFTFWDSTDETTPGTDSQNCVLCVKDFTLDLVDGKAPTSTVNPFHWTSLTDNSIYNSSSATSLSGLKGHIELESSLDTTKFSDSAGEYDDDPKVSGLITITGSAYDETCLNKINIGITGISLNGGTAGDQTTMATYNASGGNSDDSKNWTLAKNGATVSSDGWAFQILTSTLNQNGHTVTWQLDLDTSKVQVSSAQVYAKNDVIVLVQAQDAHPNTSDTSSTTNTVAGSLTPYYRMDIVPYVTGLTTKLSSLKSNNPSVYNRTALGHYPVNASESVTVTGFNIGSSATAVLPTSTATVDNTISSNAFSIASTATSGNMYVKVNSVGSLNNDNSNTAVYNQQHNGDNNNLLTDDLDIDVWKVKDSARSHSGTLTEPVMRIVPAVDTASTNDVMRFAFTNGAEYFSMAPAYSTQKSYQYWQKNYADFNNVAFTYDSAGNSYGIATGLDTYPDGTATLAGRMTFISSRWGACDIDGSHSSSNGMDDNYWGYHKLRLEAIGIMKGAYVQGTKLTDDYIMDTRRFSSPVLTTAVHESDTSVYLAYYDKFQKQIRFRYGTFSSTTSTPTSTSSTHNTGFNQFLDQHGQADTRYPNDTYYHNDKYAFDAAIGDYSLIAGKDAETSTDTGNSAGKYVAIDVVPGSSTATDVVVAVWYDGSDLKYSYKQDPYTNYNADQTHAGIDGYWSPATTIFTDGGKYCAIKVDPNGGIHIAAQDSSNQDLKYAYLSAYNASYTESADAVTVDSYGIVGTQVQIDTEIEEVKSSDGTTKKVAVPYISYYNGATERPKMAYLVPQTTMNYTAAGTDSTTEMFTGKWEVTLVPTNSEVQDDHMNIGLWKTKTGVKRTSVGGASTTDSIGETSGYCYGNGTANPVVGYATVNGTQGYIETAQKQ